MFSLYIDYSGLDSNHRQFVRLLAEKCEPQTSAELGSSSFDPLPAFLNL